MKIILIAAGTFLFLFRHGQTPRGYNMSAKARIKRAEKALKPKEQIEIIWLEPDENGNYPPPRPGEKVINLKWEFEA